MSRRTLPQSKPPWVGGNGPDLTVLSANPATPAMSAAPWTTAPSRATPNTPSGTARAASRTTATGNRAAPTRTMATAPAMSRAVARPADGIASEFAPAVKARWTSVWSWTGVKKVALGKRGIWIVVVGIGGVIRVIAGGIDALRGHIRRTGGQDEHQAQKGQRPTDQMSHHFTSPPSPAGTNTRSRLPWVRLFTG